MDQQYHSAQVLVPLALTLNEQSYPPAAQPLPAAEPPPVRRGKIKGACALTDVAVRALKAGKKPYKRGDGRGLYVLVTPNGAKSFRWDYRFQGNRQTLTYGCHPDRQLAKVRIYHTEARQWLEDGKNPAVEWEKKWEALKGILGYSLREIGESIFPPSIEGAPKREMRDGKLRQIRGATERQRLEMYIYPKLGHYDIRIVTKEQITAQLDSILLQGKQELARRVRMHCRTVWDAAIKQKKCIHNIVNDTEKIKRPPKRSRRHHAAIKDPRRYGDLLRSVDAYECAEIATRYLWKILPHIILRSSEIRYLRWVWVNFETHEIRVPAQIMKRPEDHIIQMSRQVEAYFRELYEYSGWGEFCFPSLRKKRPMSENTLNVALRTMGFKKEEHTAHGCRTFFSTQLRENGWPRDPVEIQLAHAIESEDETEAAYNHAEYLPLRRVMMQWHSDYLDSLRLKQPKPAIPYAQIRIALAQQSFMHDPMLVANEDESPLSARGVTIRGVNNNAEL